MSYNFGTPKTPGGGFTLSTPTSTPVAQNPGLNFASGDNKSLSTPQPGAKTPSFGGTPSSAAGFQLGGPAPAPTLAFGGTPSATTGFQLGGAAPAPTLSFGGNTPSQNVSFNVASTPAPATTSGTSALTGFSLGSALAQTSTPSLLSGGLAAATSAPTLSLGAPASLAPNFNLGSTTTSNASGFTLGGISSTGLTLGTPAVSSSTGNTFNLGKVSAPPASAATGLSLATTSAPTALTSTTAAAATLSTPAGSFTFSQLEEALNKWTLELEDQGKMFINQALQLNAWDRLVIANGEKILTLNNGIEKVKQQQQQLDHELDFVLAQQRELEECILPLEKELKDIPITDQDRNHTYQMAENMDTQLKQMSEDLKEIIEHLNESNKTEDTNDPVAQIGRILNAHMNSLQWIDRNTAQISTFLDQISKMHDMHRRDNERSFHLTYE